MADLSIQGDNVVLDRSDLVKRKSAASRVLHTMRRYPQLAIGTLVVLVFVVAGIGAPVLAPHPPYEQNLLNRLQPPAWAGGTSTHLLGTDQFGRDILSRLLYGARVSLVVGFFSVIIAGAFGSLVGLVSGYRGGNLDAFLMRVVDIQLAFPYILLAILIAAFWGAGLIAVIVALSISGWMGFARMVRSLVLGIKDSQYAISAKASGATTTRVMFRHLIPNIVGPMLVYATFQMPTRILAEATLSFLGLGIQPPEPSWGNMLAESRTFMISYPWMVILPGLCLSVVAVGANLFGDGLRDYLDPRTRRR